jgi:hypothetical protein
MDAMQTSMPRTAQATAAVADGMHLSAIPAAMPWVASLPAGNSLGIELSRYRRGALEADSEGVTVI